MIAIDKGNIARWKIDTPFENWLSRRADNSNLFKTLYCTYYSVFDKKYYKNGIAMAEKVYNTYNGQELFGNNKKAVIKDMIYCLHRFGFSFNEYFLYELYKKNTMGRDEFVADKMRYEYYCIMNTDEGKKLLRDKGKTYELFKPYFKRECLKVYSVEDRQSFLDYVKKHDRFIYKPIGEDCGRGVRIITSLEHEPEKLFDGLLASGHFILEELICQSDEMAKFHKSSINTVRVVTINCKDGVHALYSFYRMGRGGAIVDNAGAGGIFAEVDIKSGIVFSKAISEYTNESYFIHPDSGEMILGYQLPDWEDAIKLVKQMALVIPEMKHIGWDLAHTDNGWVLVEANGSGQPVSQMASKRGIKKELMKCMENL